jgi:hypothetical protein
MEHKFKKRLVRKLEAIIPLQITVHYPAIPDPPIKLKPTRDEIIEFGIDFLLKFYQEHK